MDVLDRISAARHDTDAIVEAANAFRDLPNEEQDEYAGVWEYAGFDEAEHPLTALLPEVHNPTYVVRDLNGSLQLLSAEGPGHEAWARGDLCRDHFAHEGTVREMLEASEWFRDPDSTFTADDLIEAIRALPSAPGPVMRF